MPIEAAPLPFRRIFVTGGDGFVGRHLVPALARRLSPDAQLILGSRVPEDRADAVAFDLCRPDSVRAAVAAVRPDAIIHLAAQASVAGSATAAAKTWQINAVGTLALAEAVAADAPNCTVLFASSVEIYGASFNDGIATIDSLPQPRSPYSRAKAAAEAMLDDVLPPATQLIIARPANHSGAGQMTAFAVPSFARQIAIAERSASGSVHVGELESRRDFLDVADVVDAYLVLLARARDLPTRSVFNIASGTSVRIGDLLDRLIAMATVPIEVVRDPARLRASEIPLAAIDSTPLRDLGWQPTVPLADTLATVLADQRALVAQQADTST